MNYKYFVHQDCSFYPCHAHETMESCLFCWCPLYLLDCGGEFKIEGGIKDCSDCCIPHIEGGYEYVFEAVNRLIFLK